MGLFWPHGRNKAMVSWDGAAGEHGAGHPVPEMCVVTGTGRELGGQKQL